MDIIINFPKLQLHRFTLISHINSPIMAYYHILCRNLHSFIPPLQSLVSVSQHWANSSLWFSLWLLIVQFGISSSLTFSSNTVIVPSSCAMYESMLKIHILHKAVWSAVRISLSLIIINIKIINFTISVLFPWIMKGCIIFIGIIFIKGAINQLLLLLNVIIIWNVTYRKTGWTHLAPLTKISLSCTYPCVSDENGDVRPLLLQLLLYLYYYPFQL